MLFLNATADMGIFHIDEKGNLAMGTFSWSVIGGTNEVGISTGLSIGVDNANDLSGLSGLTHNYGAGVALGGVPL